MFKKTVIINRAVPGSGKTTITNCIVQGLRAHDRSVAVHSTDEYFMQDHRYVFELEKLSAHHAQNLFEFEQSLKNATDVVICDNTNIAPWQSQPYTALARAYGYAIVLITLDPRELEKHVASQTITPQKPDAHGVSEAVLKKMIKEYGIYDDLIHPATPIDENKHIHFRWDPVKKDKVKIGTATHFDSDIIIRILPHEYHYYQEHISTQVLNFIKENTHA